MTERKKVRLPYGAKKYDIPESKKILLYRAKKYDFHRQSKKVRLPYKAKKYDFHTEQKSTTKEEKVRLSCAFVPPISI